jgi:hypothetical protein
VNNLKLRKIKIKRSASCWFYQQILASITIAWSQMILKISFSHTTASGVELWVIDVASAN